MSNDRATQTKQASPVRGLKFVGNDAAPGTFEGYASRFEETDDGHDRVIRGAFSKSLATHRQEGTWPPMLWQHDRQTPIGEWDVIREDPKGLYVKGRLWIDDDPAPVEEAVVAYRAMRAQQSKLGLSVGYRTIRQEYDPKDGARKLLELDLVEISPVSFPMLRSARVTNVKSSDDPIMGALAGATDHGTILRVSQVKMSEIEQAIDDVAGLKDAERILREAGFSRKGATGIVGAIKALVLREAATKAAMSDMAERVLRAASVLTPKRRKG